MVNFERICLAYENCKRRKSNKQSSLEFSFGLLCEQLQKIVDLINNREYVHGDSTCFAVLYPCPREIFAAQFRDRIIQTFYCEEIQGALDKVLLPNTASCRKEKGTDYALHNLMEYISQVSEKGTRDAYFFKNGYKRIFYIYKQREVERIDVRLNKI